MLTLTRRRGERLNIGLNVEITILDVSAGRVRLGVEAPRRMQVHRGEIVDRMELANRSALLSHRELPEGESHGLHFPDGLIGLRQYEQMLLCEAADRPGFFVLVATDDPCVQLLVVEASRVLANYPVDEAQAAAGLANEESVVAVVVTRGADQEAWANLQAPIVIGAASHEGRQIILFREDLPVRFPVNLDHLAALELADRLESKAEPKVDPKVESKVG